MTDPTQPVIIPGYIGPDRRGEISETEREMTRRIRAACDQRFISLEAWQERQNGSLQRIESKVDKLFFGTLTVGGGLIVAVIVEAFVR
jgi:hypothetical protein